MRLRRWLLVTALLLSSFSQYSGLVASGPPLRLHRALVESQASNGNPTLRALLARAPGPYAIIQFDGPITLARRDALDATGVSRLEYLPDFAYLVRGTPAQIERAAALPGVSAQSAFTIADKFAPALLRLFARGASALGRVNIVGWPDDRGELARDLQSLAVDTHAAQSAGALLQIANLESVRWIEPAGQPRILNDVARSIMNVDPVWQTQSLFGGGQTIAVLDSGLDVGITTTLSPDFAGRIVATHVLTPGGDLVDQNGHGTHVTGSAAGAGVQSGAITATHQYSGSFAGVAPEASLVIQAFEVDSSGQILGLGTDYYPWFNQAYADGARLHSDSWGDNTGPITDTAAAYGGYPFGSQRTDQFMWDHPDMAIFFAAGNSGKDGTPAAFGFCTGGDGVVDPDSLLEPGTAKNVITVGAAESYRLSGGLSAYPWLLVNFCFGVAPIATDLVSNNANGMAAFSSRGPTDDGRTKPDIVAPGTNIVSNRSHDPNASTLWGVYETNSDYVYSGGTSMATPLTAGAGALVREWLSTRGLADPSAAAVKATLLNTTHDMAPGQYGTGATQEIPYTRPNSVNGWGRVDLGFITAGAPYGLWVDDHTSGLSTGQVVTYTNAPTRSLQVVTNTQPLRLMLAWTDPPASLSASAQLVNDLDLVVIGPDSTVYHGNNVQTGDRTNNVEGIVINSPPVGQYTVQVQAYNVPIASQPYALVVGGPIGTAAPVPAQLRLAKTATPPAFVAPGGLITYTLSLSASQAITSAVTLSDTLPLSTTFVSASDGGVQGGLNGRVVEWSIPSLTANVNVTRTLVVQVDPSASNNMQIMNADYLATHPGDVPGVGTPVIVTVQAKPPASLSLAKTANAPDVPAGGLITYTLSLSASQGITSAVLLTDTLPVSTTFVSASDGGAQSGLNGRVIQWTIPTLAANVNVTRTLVVQVDAGASAGTAIVNADYQASSVNAQPTTGAPVSVTVQAPSPGTLTLSKSANAAEVAPGGLITYTLGVGAKSATVDGVVLTDTLPLSTTFAGASGTFLLLVDAGSSSVRWDLGSLTAGQTVTRTLTVRVASDVPRSAVISNASYETRGNGTSTVTGLPVNVAVEKLHLWLPLIMR